MRFIRAVAAYCGAILVAAACANSDAPTSSLSGDRSGTIVASNGQHVSHVNILDACDPTTFNAALGDGACTRSGGVTFAQFIAQLTKQQSVEAWRFAPQNVQARVGDLLVAINKGGEEHTFTEVEDFGGGMVPELNALAGTPIPAPECLAVQESDHLHPGQFFSEDVEEAGTEHYQCCIHPWMRATVVAR
jgi:plastocyanin